ncbi:hypothetical protein [Nocardioides ungokensis]|uniref:hypothetical protein n=1 Tax=Nocardioides ungokensis TaxID=1643322 RepID=UPI0015DEBF93|nr:hypothetical protein [Nocardioides ungokensis]
MARRYIDGEAPTLAEQSLDELQGTATASEWLSDTKVRIPTAEEARGQRTIENLLRPLRGLVAEGFVGRKAELQQLSDYAEVLPPSSRKASATRRVRRFLSGTSDHRCSSTHPEERASRRSWRGSSSTMSMTVPPTASPSPT